MICMHQAFPADQARFLLKTSALSAISCGYAIYRGHTHLVFVPGSVLLTSLNYWRNPCTKSWRRTLDIGVVYGSLTYQIYMTRRAQYANCYYGIILVCGLCYYGSSYYYKKQEYWKSAYCHSMIHILGNISNMILYYGNIITNYSFTI